MEKQKLLFEQSRLADRGAAEMILMYISSSNGRWSDMVISTIELGISILRGGNSSVQKVIINYQIILVVHLMSPLRTVKVFRGGLSSWVSLTCLVKY